MGLQEEFADPFSVIMRNLELATKTSVALSGAFHVYVQCLYGVDGFTAANEQQDAREIIGIAAEVSRVPLPASVSDVFLTSWRTRFRICC